ncbi:MAG: beta-ketoacyl-[acyl-carrier-protein] synthase II [Acidobacteria bacterium]|nr:MAG: beta-ketoacyl-[acyl-carrier-protein] synthase II [Acidobacteriota bacterium]
MRRVVITGLGVFSSTGKNTDSFFENLVQGRSGVKPISQFDSSPLSIKIAAEIPDYNADEYFPAKRQDMLDKFTQFALIAAGEAMESSGLKVRDEERCRFGVVMGSGMGGAGSYDAGYHNLYAKRLTRLHPFTIPRIMHNAATSHICMEFGAQGPALATSTACSSSGHAIGEAFHLIKFGMADMVLAGGADAPITYGVMRCWEAVRVLASGNGDPAAACRPFSADRKGMVIGEGSGVILLEELDHALDRGATIYGELAGCGMSSDASHITQPSVDGPVRAIRMALDEAGVGPEEIDYINAHGTGTRLNDAVETQVIKEVFNSYARKLAISSTKSMHGHAMGATGAIEFVATVMAIGRGVIPPTANYTQPDPECDLDYVPNVARERRIRAALSNSFAFGGLNAVLLVRRWE